MTHSRRLLIIGPSAPPYNGMTLATELVYRATENRFTQLRLDTADRRGLSNIGKLDLGNIWLALLHGTKFLWILLIERPDLVYVPISQASLPFLRDCLFLIPARWMRRSTIVHLHGAAFANFYRNASALIRVVIRYALGRAACGIVLGKNLKGIFEGVIPPERIHIVPNGIPDYFENRLENIKHHRTPVLLFLGTLVAEKGFLDLLRALPEARKRIGDVRVVFAGEWYSPADKREADLLVKKYALDPYVEFVGPVGPDRKYTLLRNADIFVFPSRNEGHPFVLLEAMASARPVISTNVGCIPEIVDDQRTGFLVDPGDVSALTEKICTLITDEFRRKQMGEAGREKFLKAFTFDRFSQRMCDVFTEVMRDRTWVGSNGAELA
jgi:glycosyltransferase involved in cell wall biosynthesis